MNLKDLIEQDFQTYHSDLQIDAFIIEKSGGSTDYGKYLQVLREVNSRMTNIKERILDLEKIQVELEQQKYKAEFGADQFERKLAAIEVKRKEIQLEDAKLLYKDTERELNRFAAHAFELKNRVGELTPERRAILDKEMWLEKIKEFAALDFIAHNKLSKETIEIIRCLPSDLKNIMLTEISAPDNLLNWFQQDKRTLPGIKDVPMLTDNNRTLK